jgi:hypothetical protein
MAGLSVVRIGPDEDMHLVMQVHVWTMDLSPKGRESLPVVTYLVKWSVLVLSSDQ